MRPISTASNPATFQIRTSTNPGGLSMLAKHSNLRAANFMEKRALVHIPRAEEAIIYIANKCYRVAVKCPSAVGTNGQCISATALKPCSNCVIHSQPKPAFGERDGDRWVRMAGDSNAPQERIALMHYCQSHYELLAKSIHFSRMRTRHLTRRMQPILKTIVN